MRFLGTQLALGRVFMPEMPRGQRSLSFSPFCLLNCGPTKAKNMRFKDSKSAYH